MIEKCNSTKCSNGRICKKILQDRIGTGLSTDNQSTCERKIGKLMKSTRLKKHYCIVRNVIIIHFLIFLQIVAHAAIKSKLNQRIRIQYIPGLPDPMNAMLTFMERMSTKSTARKCTFIGCISKTLLGMFQIWLQRIDGW